MVRAYAVKIGTTLLLFIILWGVGMIFFGSPATTWDRAILWLLLWMTGPSVTEIRVSHAIDEVRRGR